MKTVTGALVSIIFLLSLNSGIAKDLESKVGVVEKLGGKIPLNAVFYDSQGKEVRLGDLITKPTVIDLAYYRCNGICTPIMTDVADVVNRIDLVPGKDYNLITVSFNPEELTKDAALKKSQIMNLLKTSIPDSAWRFLTGDSANISELTKAVGFNYDYKNGVFIHTGVLVFVSKEGKICRYIKPGDADSGIDAGALRILPVSFKMAILDASKNQAIPVVDNEPEYCFDGKQPKDKAMVDSWFEYSGAGILVMVAALFVFVVLKPRKVDGTTKNLKS